MARIRIFKLVIMVSVVSLANSLSALQAEAAAEEITGGHGIASPLTKLDNATYLTCRDASKGN